MFVVSSQISISSLLSPDNALAVRDLRAIYSISMCSRLPDASPSVVLSGVTSAATPLTTSTPARRRCLAARTRRSPGTRT